MSQEIYKRYRPRLLKEVIGNGGVIELLGKKLKDGKVPHSILFSGPSGCGKTTLARIIAKKLKCSKGDFNEVNAADVKGIDAIRSIRNRMNLAPIGGNCRVWLFDEAHKITSDAQNALLKMLEDTPEHVYFFLATTDPQKLLPTVRNRCTSITVASLKRNQVLELIDRVLTGEKAKLSEEVQEKIVEVCEGSARKALVLLDTVLAITDEAEQLIAVENSMADPKAIELARHLMAAKPAWPKISKLLKDLTEEPEALRWMILGYCNAIILSNPKLAPRAYLVIDGFRDNFYDSKKAGLSAACWEIINR